MQSMPLFARLVAVLPLLFVFAPTLARADALPPPQPIACPAGSHMVHDHGGTHCVQDAPKDCPVGWIGRSGGVCELVLCRDDASCGGGRCKEVDLCAFDDPAHLRWSALDPAPRGPVALLAAPPSSQRARVFSGPCGAGGVCRASETCRRASVCLPANVDAPASRPKNGSAAVTFGDERGIPDFRPSEAGAPEESPEVVSSVESESARAARESPPAAPRPGKTGGCAGCSTVPSGAPEGWLALFAGALLVGVLRRRNG